MKFTRFVIFTCTLSISFVCQAQYASNTTYVNLVNAFIDGVSVANNTNNQIPEILKTISRLADKIENVGDKVKDIGDIVESRTSAGFIIGTTVAAVSLSVFLGFSGRWVANRYCKNGPPSTYNTDQELQGVSSAAIAGGN